MIALWIVGEPGVGKSTLVRELLGPDPVPTCANITYATNGARTAAAGLYRDGDAFGGPDRLPPHEIYPTIERLRPDNTGPLLLIDGDKLSTERARKTLAWATRWCVLVEDEERAAINRIARGSAQNETWIKGRRTKARNFFYTFDDECRASGTQAQMRTWLQRFVPRAVAA